MQIHSTFSQPSYFVFSLSGSYFLSSSYFLTVFPELSECLRPKLTKYVKTFLVFRENNLQQLNFLHIEETTWLLWVCNYDTILRALWLCTK